MSLPFTLTEKQYKTGKHILEEVRKARWRQRPLAGPGRKPTIDIELESLSDNRNEYSEAESKFLYWLDMEIKKIDDFYREKEKIASERYKYISVQLEALRQLGDSHITNETNKLFQGTSHPEPSSRQNAFDLRTMWKTLMSKLHTSLDSLSSAMPADHARRVKRPELMAKPITTTAGYVDYRVARRRLKEAIVEFYRGMELLKDYRLLNRTGMTKILKKFDKVAGRQLSEDYAEKIRSMHFDQSQHLDSLMDRTEAWAGFRIS